MFDFFKKKSYTVTQENGMEKLVTAADMNKAAEDALKALEALPDNYIKDLIDYTKSSIDHGNISKEFLKMIIKIVDAVSTKKAKEVQKSLDDEAPAPKPKEEKKEEPKKEEESKEEPKKDDILDLDKVASVNKENIVRFAADTNPASSKYRAEGIKEKLLEINKEVAIKSDNKVQNIGNNTKGIITPGDKGTIVKVKEETVKPDIVVENVKIKIIRDDGEFEKLFPEKNIKFPTGDKVVIKASQDVEIDTAKLQTKSEEEKKEVGEAMQSGDPTKIKQVVEKTGIEKSSSIYNQVMNIVFNRSAETEDDNSFEEEVKEDLSLLNNKE